MWGAPTRPAPMTLIVTIAALTLAASFLCSLFEAALYAVTPSQIELMKDEGVRGSQRLARLRQDVEEPIAAILTVNTIAHTVGASWCGALVGTLYDDRAVVIFATVFTLLVLGLTEIVPKSLGVRHAATLAPRLAWAMELMVRLAWPIARPARAAMRMLTGGGESHAPSEEEVMVFAGMAARHGEVRDEEHTWVRNALRLDQVRAGDLMTPRPVVEMYQGGTTIDEAIGSVGGWVHSRVPIHEGDSDQVDGIVFRREVFEAAVRGEGGRPLRDFVHPLSAVPQAMPGHQLLRLFLRERRHMVAVVSEYGGFEGLVTLEDVLEEMLGEEIVDEHDRIVDLQEHARQRNPHASAEPTPGEDEEPQG